MNKYLIITLICVLAFVFFNRSSPDLPKAEVIISPVVPQQEILKISTNQKTTATEVTPKETPSTESSALEKTIDLIFYSAPAMLEERKLYACIPKDSNNCKSLCQLTREADGQEICIYSVKGFVYDNGYCVTKYFNCMENTREELSPQDLKEYFNTEDLDRYLKEIRNLELVITDPESIKKCFLSTPPGVDSERCFK